MNESGGKTGSRRQIARDTDRDFYMSAQAAKEYGIIDAVIEKTNDPVLR